MTAYLWVSPRSAAASDFAMYDRHRSPDRFLLQKGERLASGTLFFVFGGEPSRLATLPVLPNSARLPLVNARALEVVRRYVSESDVQVVPASVEFAGGCTNDYSVLNPLVTVHCIDHARSRYTVVTGTNRPLHFEELHHRPDCLGSMHLAREADYRSHLLVSADIRNAFLSRDLGGVEFMTPEEFVEASALGP